MGYRSVVEPLPDMLEDSIPCNKEGRKRGRDRGRDGERQCVCGGGGNSQVVSEICHQPGVSNYLASPNARSLGIRAADLA